MKKSDSIKELAAALAMAQASMGFAKKDAANPYFKSKYADLAAVVEAIKKPLTEHGLSYSQGTDIDEHGGVIVETMLMHKSGEWIEGRLRMIPVKADPQGIGSCITYARRYGLQAIVGVPADDDDGNAASGNETNANGTKKGSGVHKPTDGALEAFTAQHGEEAVRYLQETAATLVEAVEGQNNVIAAVNMLEDAGLDNDEKLALWAILAPNNKTRNAIKKESERRRQESALGSEIQP